MADPRLSSRTASALIRAGDLYVERAQRAKAAEIYRRAAKELVRAVLDLRGAS